MPLAMVTNLRGDPEPPTDVVRRLHAVDPGLTIRWAAQHKQWAVVRAWPESDRRWAWVQSQKYSPAQAHDILGYVPNDCATDQVPSYVANLLRDWPVAEAKELLSRMDRYNTNPDEVQAQVAEAAEAVIEAVAAPKKSRGTRVAIPKPDKGA